MNRKQQTAATILSLLFPISCFLLPALLTGCQTTSPPLPLDQLDAQQVHGHQYFMAHCGQCHYDRQPGPLHGPSLLGMYKKPYLPSGAPSNNERVSEVILHGHKLMPAEPNTDPTDLEDLLAYLHTL